jgi:hypothetical protein
MFHKSPVYAGVKIYNHLTANIKSFKNTKELFGCAYLLYSEWTVYVYN